MWGRPGLDSRLRLHGGRLCAGTTGGDVGMRGEGEHEKGQVSNFAGALAGKTGGDVGMGSMPRYYVWGGRAVREPPLRRGTARMDGGRWRCGQDWGMDSRLRLHGGRLCAGTTGGDVGMRVSTRRGKFQTCPYVRGSIGIMWGRDGRFANRPYEEGGQDGGRMALRAGLGDGFPPSSSRGQALRGNNRGYGNEGRG